MLPGLWALSLAKEARATPKQMAQLFLLLLEPRTGFSGRKPERERGNRTFHLTAAYPRLFKGIKAGRACSGSADLTSGVDTSPYEFPTAGTGSPDPSCNRGSPATVNLDDDKGAGQLVMHLS